MESIAKQIIEFSKKPLHEKLKIQFVNYLKDHFHKKELIDLAEQIEWLPVTKLFEIEFSKLWRKMVIPNETKELKKLKITFTEQILNNIRVRLFQFTYHTLISYSNDEKLKQRKLSDVMNENWNFDMYELFRVFDFQLTLTSLNKNNDKKVIIRTIEELKLNGEIGKSFRKGKSQVPIEILVFRMIKNEYIKLKSEGRYPKIRSLAYHFGKKVLKYGEDDDHPQELENFYKRFLTFNKKSIPDA